jgi:hypothetical protein
MESKAGRRALTTSFLLWSHQAMKLSSLDGVRCIHLQCLGMLNQSS